MLPCLQQGSGHLHPSRRSHVCLRLSAWDWPRPNDAHDHPAFPTLVLQQPGRHLTRRCELPQRHLQAPSELLQWHLNSPSQLPQWPTQPPHACPPVLRPASAPAATTHHPHNPPTLCMHPVIPCGEFSCVRALHLPPPCTSCSNPTVPPVAASSLRHTPRARPHTPPCPRPALHFSTFHPAPGITSAAGPGYLTAAPRGMKPGWMQARGQGVASPSPCKQPALLPVVVLLPAGKPHPMPHCCAAASAAAPTAAAGAGAVVSQVTSSQQPLITHQASADAGRG